MGCGESKAVLIAPLQQAARAVAQQAAGQMPDATSDSPTLLEGIASSAEPNGKGKADQPSPRTSSAPRNSPTRQGRSGSGTPSSARKHRQATSASPRPGAHSGSGASTSQQPAQHHRPGRGACSSPRQGQSGASTPQPGPDRQPHTSNAGSDQPTMSGRPSNSSVSTSTPGTYRPSSGPPPKGALKKPKLPDIIAAAPPRCGPGLPPLPGAETSTGSDVVAALAPRSPSPQLVPLQRHLPLPPILASPEQEQDQPSSSSSAFAAVGRTFRAALEDQCGLPLDSDTLPTIVELVLGALDRERTGSIRLDDLRRFIQTVCEEARLEVPRNELVADAFAHLQLQQEGGDALACAELGEIMHRWLLARPS